MANGFILIVVGLLLFYVVISDKFHCLVGCAACLSGKLDGQSSEASGGLKVGSTPIVPDLVNGASRFLRPGEPLGGGVGGMLGLGNQ